jgi:hypothetical protein
MTDERKVERVKHDRQDRLWHIVQAIAIAIWIFVLFEGIFTVKGLFQ